MSLVKNNFLPASEYNKIPFIDEMEHAAEYHKDDLSVLTGLLQKHGLPFNVYVKLLHIHSHQEDGNIVAWSEFDAPLIGKIPFLAPLTPTKNTLVRGCHFLVDYTGDLQAFEYTTNMDCVDLAAYPAFVNEFCASVVERDLQTKFGLGIKSGVAETGVWTELDYPEKRATFLLPEHIETPKNEALNVRTTKTQFVNPTPGVQGMVGHAHQHAEITNAEGRSEGNEAVIDGVTTKGGFALSGIPLHPGTDFYRVVSALSVAA